MLNFFNLQVTVNKILFGKSGKYFESENIFYKLFD